jgi:hypothetical protein
MESADCLAGLPRATERKINDRRRTLERFVRFMRQWHHAIDPVGHFDPILRQAILMFEPDHTSAWDLEQLMSNFRFWKLWRLELPITNAVNHLRLLDRAYDSDFDPQASDNQEWVNLIEQHQELQEESLNGPHNPLGLHTFGDYYDIAYNGPDEFDT